MLNSRFNNVSRHEIEILLVNKDHNQWAMGGFKDLCPNRGLVQPDTRNIWRKLIDSFSPHVTTLLTINPPPAEVPREVQGCGQPGDRGRPRSVPHQHRHHRLLLPHRPRHPHTGGEPEHLLVTGASVTNIFSTFAGLSERGQKTQLSDALLLQIIHSRQINLLFYHVTLLFNKFIGLIYRYCYCYC